MALAHGSVLTERVIGLAIEVHRHLGPGLLESAYEECLCFELRENAIAYGRRMSLQSAPGRPLYIGEGRNSSVVVFSMA